MSEPVSDCSPTPEAWLADQVAAINESERKALAPSAVPSEGERQPDEIVVLIEAVRDADAAYERTCLARQNAESAYNAKVRARVALADAVLAADGASS